jgi:hypothetical protein
MIRRGVLALVLLTACESSKTTAPAEPRSSLRVPLPEGWKASSRGADLQVGPQGRVVLLLENTARPFPETEAFVASVEAEGVEILQKESVDTFIGVRYSFGAEGAKRDGFLGVRQTGPRTIWCSTSASAKNDEVEAAMTVCRSLSWEG